MTPELLTFYRVLYRALAMICAFLRSELQATPTDLHPLYETLLFGLTHICTFLKQATEAAKQTK